MGLRELRGSLSKQAFAAEARRYVPDVSADDLVPASAGVRAQALDPDGSLVDDFRIHRLGPITAVRNAPSPGATSSLAIAEHIAAAALSQPVHSAAS
jgi:L-2-hydroxyglutarate oxidase LhgO